MQKYCEDLLRLSGRRWVQIGELVRKSDIDGGEFCNVVFQVIASV